jgi:DNA-binding LacI/PurR family transcriptional regulator
MARAVASGELPGQVERLLARQVEGLILLGLGPREASLLDGPLARAGCPAVLCGAAPADFPAAQVGVDQREGMRLAAAHLLDLGHRRFAYLDAAPDSWPYGPRREGFQAALDALDRAPEALVVTTDGGSAGGYQAGERLLEGVDRPTAFLCANDAIAVGLLRAAWRRGVRVPEQAAVVGFGDHPVAAYSVPTLTTVRGSLQAAGAMSGRLLVQAVRDSERPRGVYHLAPKLVIRESCGSHLWL